MCGVPNKQVPVVCLKEFSTQKKKLRTTDLDHLFICGQCGSCTNGAELSVLNEGPHATCSTKHELTYHITYRCPSLLPCCCMPGRGQKKSWWRHSMVKIKVSENIENCLPTLAKTGHRKGTGTLKSVRAQPQVLSLLRHAKSKETLKEA